MIKLNLTTKALAFAKVMLVAVFLCGCSRGERGAKVIVTKSYGTFMGNPMPKGLCRYYYREWSGMAEAQEFTDSCGRYNIGDTIVGSKK